MRGCGMLLPVSSIPSRYGIGAFSKEAYEFVDMLKEAGQKYWQILPLGPTGLGDSPYQSFSTFAGNPYFIDLEALIQEGLLKKEECDACDFGDHPNYVDYGKLYQNRYPLLRTAYERSRYLGRQEFLDFKKKNRGWVRNYALYMALKNHFGGAGWDTWDEDIRTRQPKALERYEEELAGEVDFYTYMQFLFRKQWAALKAYANKKGIQIIGDIPIYVAFDSADTWANPELFQFTKEGRPAAVAGCPPDGFSATGQLWGNPVYNWDYHEKTGYAWWLERIGHCFELYDVVRVDHFRGFDEYYAIPYGDKTAEFGKWEKGPGIKLFDRIREVLGDKPIIAEDLGFLTPTVLQLVEDTGFPGMKVLEFAFDSGVDCAYLPHNHTKNSVVYTGTHDNQTLRAWYREMPEGSRRFADDYLNLAGRTEEEILEAFIRAALGSVADTAIIPVQDYLGLGAEARINAPSTFGDNWKWRMSKGAFTPEKIKKIAHLAEIYGRI